MSFMSEIKEMGSGGDAILDGGIDWFKTDVMNRANDRQAKDQRSFHQINSDTSYQRAAADLRKAGINPILAGKFGGASTPAGAMATMGRSSSLPFTTAKAMQKSDSETGKNNATTALTDANKLLADEKLPIAEFEALAPKAALKVIETALQNSETVNLKNVTNVIQKLQARMPQSKLISGIPPLIAKYTPEKQKAIMNTLRNILNAKGTTAAKSIKGK